MTPDQKRIRIKIRGLIEIRSNVQRDTDWENPVQALRDIELCQEITDVGADLFKQLPEEMRINLNSEEA
jgi:ABC-type uncharacterized transport system ATPase subunit